MNIGRKTLAYLVGVLITYLVGTILVSQFNLARIVELGYAVGLVERLQTTLHDWLGMLSSYLPLIAIAMLIAWLFTGLLLTRFVSRSAWLYALAGLVGVVALHQIMAMVFGITGIAATRSSFGLLAQGLAGALGGWVFYRIAYAPKDQGVG
jgi:hypothetical protein